MLQQTEVQKSVYTAFRDSPFALQESVKEVYVKAGSSIQEIIDESIQEEWQRKYLRVVLNDEVIQPENYALTFVNEKDVVGMVLVPQDGDVGQIFKAIAVIAIVVAVAWALGPSGYALVGVEVAAGIGAAAGLAASLALNALFPPPVPGLPSTGSSGTSEDPVYGFSRTGNQLNKYAAIPRIYGCRKVFPQHAIAPYIIAFGSDQYLYQAFTVGYGPIKIEEIKIGENPIGNYKDVEYYVHESFEAGDELKIVKQDNWLDPYSITLLQNEEHIISTTDNANAASVAIQFPQGMYYFHTTDGKKTGWDIDVEIQIRQSGTSTWNTLTNYNPVVTYGTLKSTVTSNTWNAIGSSYSENPNHAVITNLPESSTVGNGEYRTLVTTINDDYGNSIESYQDYQNSYIVDTATSIVNIGGASSRPFFVNVDVSFPSAAKWDIRIVRLTENYDGSLNHITGCNISSLRSIKNIPPIAPEKPIGLIELKIKATDQLNGSVNNLSCVVTSKLPVWNGFSWSIQETRNPAWAYLDVMRGSAAKKVVPDSRIDLTSFLDWANWCDEIQPNFQFTPPTVPDINTNIGYVTNLYYTILFRVPETDGLNFWVNKLNTGEFTRAQVQAFFYQSEEAAAINRAKCDLEVTSQTTAWEVLKLIAATGYATPSQNGGKYSIAVDKQKTTPVQVFTPKNIKSFSGNMSYYTRPHALRIEYTQTNQTDTDEIIVYDDGYNADGSDGKLQATVFETMKLVGISRYNQAYTVGRRAIAQGKLRIEKFTISCDVENLLATRGSLVRLQHDIPKIGSGSGRIVKVVGSIITIDEEFKLTTGSIYANVRHLDGSQTTHTLTNVSGSTAIISGLGVAEGDLIIYGELDHVNLECLVKSIRPGNDLTATLELVPYAPAIYTAETETIPERNPFGSDWTGGGSGGTNTGNKLMPGLVTSLQGSYLITYDNKTPRITVNLSWNPPVIGGTVAKYQVWYEDTTGWSLLGETTELTYLAFNEYIFTDANGDIIDLNGKSMKFAVSGVGTDGSSINPEYAKQVTITPVVSAPKEIASLNATARYIANEISWTYTDDPFDSQFVEIWASNVNDRSTAFLVGKIDVPLTFFNHTGLVGGDTWFYWVKTSDGNGNYSSWYPNSNNTTVSAIVLAVESQYIDISGFTGFRKSAGSAYTPTNATLTAITTGIENPTYSWTVTGATTGATNLSTVTITPDNSDTKITVTLTVDGDNLVSVKTKTIIMPINIDGAAGEAGANGVMSAFPTIYQWTSNSTPPSRPTTTSTYTWGTGEFTAPSGWYTYAPNNTTAGSYLWSITVPLNTVATTTTSILDWTNTGYSIRAIAYNGANGSNGTNGTNGTNGAATFVINRSANDSSAPTNTEVTNAIGRTPVSGDIVTVSYNNYNNAVVYRYTTSWSLFSTYITGSLIVQNTITADRLVSKTITAASGVIGDAAVNTLQIAGNAVTVPTVVSVSSSTLLTASFQTVASTSIALDYAGTIYASITGNQSYADGNMATEHRIVIDGTVVAFAGTGVALTPVIAISGAISLSAGTKSIQYQVRYVTGFGPGTTVYISGISMYAQGAKR